ncbi:Fis family transcriptional regulator [Thermoanaerobaculum aquaticum]|uniref:Fis family transcriptional regulator n=1 Tax=Thermoanaerobaculum aquaticum TaxID=1312852 RepID=A0A062XTU8_9BACT|nr:sigma-54 dependent transcriptional regulator [Thermoanaerobaculum aquaticum]KDA54273.1 Fis family transcriptional regulator [Thermoanaerobaculum aquaticum]
MNTRNARLLIVDDELHMRESLARWFLEDGYEVETAGDAKAALALLGRQTFDAIITDIRMPGMDGLELLKQIKEVNPHATIILITAYASVASAVEALKAGAYDYLVKPFDPEELSRVVERACERARLQQENIALKERLAAAGRELVVGESEAMKRVMSLVETVAPTETTVMIRGESGTGKELIARLIHANSPRAFGPLVAVNCGALPEGVLESELFGHERGAFTGAVARRKGKLELADGGTLFLDEVGEISPKVQVELLRVLEEKQLVRVGGTQPVRVDFRVVCATNRDLEQAVREGTFREDLYYRLAVFRIDLPPLRERKEDILPIANHYLKKFADAMGRKVTGFSPKAQELLLSYPWPGNIRELINAVERALVVCREGPVLPEHLPITPSKPVSLPKDDDLSLEAVERRHIEYVLERCSYNITQAAKLLGIDRVTLYNRMRRYGINWHQRER